MKLLTFLVLLVLLLVYAIIGGVILRAIELDHELNLKSNVNSTVNAIISASGCLSLADVRDLEDIVDDMDVSGVFLLSDGSAFFRNRFDVRTSILIASGIVGGFGIKNAVPYTVGGKVFTAFYGLLIGFYQFFVICVIGDLMDVVLRYLYRKLTKRYGLVRASWFYQFRQVFMTVVGFVFFIVIPAAIVHAIELWSYGESLFYCLVNVITIGFGDYSPGASEVRGQSEEFVLWYRMCLGFWLLMSIVWFAGILYQFNSVITGILWRTTEEVIDEGMEQIDQKISKIEKVNLRTSIRRLAPLRPLSPLTPLPLTSTTTTTSATGTGTSTSTSKLSVVSDPNYTVEQESSGDVSVIRLR